MKKRRLRIPAFPLQQMNSYIASLSDTSGSSSNESSSEEEQDLHSDASQESSNEEEDTSPTVQSTTAVLYDNSNFANASASNTGLAADFFPFITSVTFANKIEVKYTEGVVSAVCLKKQGTLKMKLELKENAVDWKYEKTAHSLLLLPGLHRRIQIEPTEEWEGSVINDIKIKAKPTYVKLYVGKIDA